MRPLHPRVLLAAILLTALPRPAVTTTPPTGAEALECSIGYHDPDGLWQSAQIELEIEGRQTDGTSRPTRIRFSNALRSFEILTERDGAVIEGLMAEPDWDCVLTLDGSTEFSTEERDRYRLTCERLAWLRDYYTYLWGLPMKLRDPGTRLDREVLADTFQGLPVWRMRVTYDASVGSDTWYFYLDRDTCRLAGYRFYHDETKRDGEYILLEGEVEVEGVKIPRRRSWYTNAEDRHLGDDLLVELEITP